MARATVPLPAPEGPSMAMIRGRMDSGFGSWDLGFADSGFAESGFAESGLVDSGFADWDSLTRERGLLTRLANPNPDANAETRSRDRIPRANPDSQTPECESRIPNPESQVPALRV